MEFLPLEKGGSQVYAGFKERFVAIILDMVVVIVFLPIFEILKGISISVAMAVMVFSCAFFTVYTVGLHYRFGATLGKMAMKIKVTRPDGGPIGMKHALLRSSVDFVFSILTLWAQFVALSNADSEQYLAAEWLKRGSYIYSFYPAWFAIVMTLSEIWLWSEVIVLLFNKRRRALHDFIAGTVVIHKRHAKAQSLATPSFAVENPGAAS